MRRMPFACLLVCVLLAISCMVTPVRAESVVEILGVGFTYIMPFPSDSENKAAIDVPIRVWPGVVPDGIVFNLLMPISNLDGLDVGISAAATTVKGNLPVRLGLNHTSDGYGWHVNIQGSLPTSPEAMAFGPTENSRRLTYSYMLGPDRVGVVGQVLW